MEGYVWSMLGKVKRTGRYTVESRDGMYITLANANTLPEARKKALSILLKHPYDEDLQERGLGVYWPDFKNEDLPLIGVVREWNGKGIWYPFDKKHPYVLHKDGKLGDKFPAEYRW